MVIMPGLELRFFKDFVAGDTYEHLLGRTFIETDNGWFTLLTQNAARIHVDRRYASKTG